MQVQSLALTLKIDQSLRAIHQSLYRKRAPIQLHHYTHPETLEKIIDTRVLWATCAADQDDQTEISHAAELLSRAAERAISSRIPRFTAEVLRRIPFFIEDRKQYAFIACFCEIPDSSRHWDQFGKYRVSFAGPGSKTPQLCCMMPNSDSWFQQVIYNERLQIWAIQKSVEAVTDAVASCVYGDVDGPIRNWFIDSCARTAGQIILSMAIGFKRHSYKWEKEWRFVCFPRLGSSSSSPMSDDRDFLAYVRKQPRKHVPLTISQETRVFEPLLRPPVPFWRWQSAPNHAIDSELLTIRNALIRNHRVDLLEPTPAESVWRKLRRLTW